MSRVFMSCFLLSSFATCGQVRAAFSLPSDVSVSLIASPSSDLVPGQIIDLTLSVTNNGPNVVPDLEIASSNFWDEFYLPAAQNDCLMGIVVADGVGFSYYYYSWIPTIYAPIDPGETLVCHIKMALSSKAPAATPFTFGVPSYISDIDPSNNSATAYIRRFVEPVPTLSLRWEYLLGVLLTLVVMKRAAATRKSDGSRGGEL